MRGVRDADAGRRAISRSSSLCAVGSGSVAQACRAARLLVRRTALIAASSSAASARDAAAGPEAACG